MDLYELKASLVHSEFEVSPSYTVRPYLERRKKGSKEGRKEERKEKDKIITTIN